MSTSKYINREISWLSFNERVLQEAADNHNPLLERIKFLGIYSSNLDEFFRVRVGTLKRLENAGIRSKVMFGGAPKKILKQINKVVREQRRKFDLIFQELMNQLEDANIFIINESQLNPEQEAFVREYFISHVRPRLVPIMLNYLEDFPELKNQVIYLAIYLEREREPRDVQYALIEVPADVLPRFIVLPEAKGKQYLIMLDDVIRWGLPDIFSMFDFDSLSAYTIKITRDAEIDIEDDVTKSNFEKISKSIRQRRFGRPVRFVYDREIPRDLLQFILKKNGLEDFEHLIPGGRYHNAKDFMRFPGFGRAEHHYPPMKPALHPILKKYRSLFDAIREQDILLHFPYQSFHHLIDLLREAAIDPQVKHIRISLYRVAQNSSIINALVNAIQNGKQVTVYVELKARFDEEANLYWTQQLEEAGAHLIEGIPNVKVHAKLCIIDRLEGKKIRQYSVIGTGNFNETTAKIYSDHLLLTADRRIAREVEKVFDLLDKKYRNYTYSHLVVAPFYMRKQFLKLIKNEIKQARAGKKAYIYAKMNSLVDKKLIDRLYEASQAGVKIRLIVRSICSLIPGVPGLSENIEAISIVDRYLEHSRLFIFGNGGKEKYFISSADWMIRNLDNRIEVAVPIYDRKLQKELKTYFQTEWRDNVKARILDGKLSNAMRDGLPDNVCRAQEELHRHFGEKQDVPSGVKVALA